MDNITKQLKAMRESYGLEPYDFSISHETIDEIIESQFQNIVEMFHYESRLLIYNGSPVFVYITDHTYIPDNTVGRFQLNNPAKLKKIHFTVCKTLREMEARRYHITNRVDGKYTITISNGKEHDVKLHPCQFCLGELGYKGFSYENMSSHERNNIVKLFNAKEVIDYTQKHFRNFINGLKWYFQTVGYPKKWNKISYDFRESKNFTCNKCKVNLSKYPHLTDCHHVNHVKSECHDDNLRCLCKECHAEEHHPHYNPEQSCIEIIQQERDRQNRARVGTG